VIHRLAALPGGLDGDGQISLSYWPVNLQPARPQGGFELALVVLCGRRNDSLLAHCVLVYLVRPRLELKGLAEERFKFDWNTGCLASVPPFRRRACAAKIISAETTSCRN
jgi:hypothetical protein